MATNLAELRRATDNALSIAEEAIAAINAHTRGEVDAYDVIPRARVRDVALELGELCQRNDPNVLAVVTFFDPDFGNPILRGLTRFAALIETVKSFCSDHARNVFAASTN